MTCEQFPSECLQHIFEYLTSVDLLRGYANLNARFHALLYHRFAFYCFNLLGMFKRHFDMICQ